MSTDFNKALSYVDAAEKRMTVAMSILCCLGSSFETRAEEAIILYLKASTIFERESAYLEAAKCYEEAALLKTKIGDDNRECLENSAYCYLHIDKSKSEELLFQCIKINERKGNYSKVAEIYEKIAKIREESELYESAYQLLCEAANYYSASSQPIHEYNCYLKAADMAVFQNLGDWKDQLDIYEKCLNYTETSVGNSTLSIEIYFKISALYLLHDVSSLI